MTNHNSNPTQGQLKEYFSYDGVTGLFTRFKKSGPNCKIGVIHGCPSSNGYRRIGFMHKMHNVHHLVWLYMTGIYPTELDHINGIRNDNRFSNLKKATRHENMLNKSKYRNNKSGVTGVAWHKRDNTWNCSICFKGEQKFIGYYDNLIDAIAARLHAERLYGFSKRHGR